MEKGKDESAFISDSLLKTRGNYFEEAGVGMNLSIDVVICFVTNGSKE
jgi:hypothetical protein